MKTLSRFFSAALALSALSLALAPCRALAVDAADNAYISQDYPDGAGGTNKVGTQVVFNSNQVNQDIVVGANGKLTINAVTKGNLSSVVVVSGSAVSLVTATPKTVTSFAFPVGTWQVYGYVDYVTTSATTTLFQQGTATTTNSFTNTLQAQDTFLADWNPMTTTSATLVKAIPFIQFTVTSGTTSVFLVGQATFSAGSATAYGTLFYRQLK